MKAKIIILLFTALLAGSCSKNKYTTKPQVKIKSISPGEVNPGDIIEISSTFTDKEGDIGDSVLIAYNKFENGQKAQTDTFPYAISSFGIPSGTKSGDLRIRFVYNQQSSDYPTLPGETEDRNVSFGIILIDLAGNRSDYVESSQILLKKS